MFSQSYVVILINKGEKTLLQLRHLHIIWLKYMEKALQKKKNKPKTKANQPKKKPQTDGTSISRWKGPQWGKVKGQEGLIAVLMIKLSMLGDLFPNEGHRVRIHP